MITVTTAFVRVDRPLTQVMSEVLKPFKIPKDKLIFIKPNLCDPCPPRSGVVVDIDVAKCLIDHLRTLGIQDIIIGEGVGPPLEIEKVFEVTRFKELEDEGVKVEDLDRAERIKIKWFYGSLIIPRILTNSFYINVAKIKTHTQTTITASLKNQKGLLLSKDKKRFHLLGLHEPIAHLAEVVRPDLILIDGIWGLEGDGPSTAGKRKKVGWLIASDNMVEVDSLCCQIIGVDPYRVKHLASAEELGVGQVKKFAVPSLNFKQANEKVFRYGRISFWRNPHACSQCNTSLKIALSAIKKNPHKYSRQFLLLTYLVLFKGLDVIVGLKGEIPEEHKEVLCVGNCTKKLASKNGYHFIPGCPPNPDNIIQALNKLD